jgi:hypothetical protein
MVAVSQLRYIYTILNISLLEEYTGDDYEKLFYLGKFDFN